MIKKATEHLIVRYLISGGTSAFVNLSVFFFLYSIVHIFYIVSSIISFVVAFGVSLFLQKFWTFRDHSTENMHIQGALYLLSSLFGLGVNTLVLYICVHFFGIIPFIGVMIAGVSTALCTFPISRKYIFHKGEALQPK
jgi:putative flippase GtrA